MMVGLDVQSVMVIVLSETNFYICNCIYGHQNCQCDGKGNKRKDKDMEYRKCKECGQHISHFEGNVCDHCMERQ
jgi:hypothetical protein